MHKTKCSVYADAVDTLRWRTFVPFVKNHITHKGKSEWVTGTVGFELIPLLLLCHILHLWHTDLSIIRRGHSFWKFPFLTVGRFWHCDQNKDTDLIYVVHLVQLVFFLFSLNRTQRHLLTPPAFKPKKTKATTVVAVSDECTFLIVRAAVTNSEAWALPEGRRRRWQSALCSDVQWKETKTFKMNLTAFKPRQDPVHQTATRLKYWDRDKDKRFLWTVTETRSPSKCVLYWIRIQFLWPLHFTLELHTTARAGFKPAIFW